jgi:hypothetical protein
LLPRLSRCLPFLPLLRARLLRKSVDVTPTQTAAYSVVLHCTRNDLKSDLCTRSV